MILVIFTSEICMADMFVTLIGKNSHKKVFFFKITLQCLTK